MPRLSPSLLRRAHSISPHLAALLPACRDITSARNELRWIREHVLSSSPFPSSSFNPISPSPLSSSSSSSSSSATSTTPRKRRRNAGIVPVNPAAAAAESVEQEARIAHLCRERGRRGVPLQYVLGSQPFGDLDIECRPGVLIPRPETEAWVFGVADLIVRSSLSPISSTTTTTTTMMKTGHDHKVVKKEKRRPPSLRIVDFCTGTGCVALLLFSLLRRHCEGLAQLSVCGFDVDEKAVALARRNSAANMRRREYLREGQGHHHAVTFERVDVFSEDWRPFLQQQQRRDENDGERSAKTNAEVGKDEEKGKKMDVLVANPPYISARGFNHDTGRSVRNHEPKLALVPDLTLSRGSGVRPEDVFYARLLQIAEQTRPGIVVLEVGDLAQAVRVVEMALLSRVQKGGWDRVEIWRDWPDMTPEEDEVQVVQVVGVHVPVKGSGNGRVVVLRCDD